MANRSRLSTYVLVLALLPGVLTGCGDRDRSGAAETETATDRPLPATPGQQGEEGGDYGRGHVTLTGDLAVDGDFVSTCGIFPDTGLQITLDQQETRAPQILVRIEDYMTDGKYPTGIVLVRQHSASGPVTESTGRVQVEVRSVNERRQVSGTSFSGTFQGTYTGGAGSGQVTGRFEGCFFPQVTS